MSNTEIVDWWINLLPLTSEEDKLIDTTRDQLVENDSEECIISEEYFNRMPFCKISSDTNIVTFSETASNLITNLFDTYVDNDTLVISSNNEHDTTVKLLSKCKHVYLLDFYKEIRGLQFSNLYKELCKYKKVFVYVIGTQISTGEITSQEFYTRLRNKLLGLNIEFKLVIDDVHGMFITPRDYSIFDYIIGTAHALIRGYDMGILISKKSNKIFGISNVDCAKTYLTLLDLILVRINKLRLFSTIMQEYFSDLLSTSDYSLLSITTPNVFALQVKNHYFTKKMIDQLFEYEIVVECENKDNQYNNGVTFIRFRAQQFIKCPEYLIEGLSLLRKILNVTKLK